MTEVCIFVNTDGAKYWRMDYRYAEKRQTLAFGKYPNVSLSDARTRRAEARKLLEAGAAPSDQRKAQKAAKSDRTGNSFEVIAREWFGKNKESWATSHANKIIARLENDIFPSIGNTPIAEITPPALLAAVRRIESRGVLETAHRALANCGQFSATLLRQAEPSVTRLRICAGRSPPSKAVISILPLSLTSNRLLACCAPSTATREHLPCAAH